MPMAGLTAARPSTDTVERAANELKTREGRPLTPVPVSIRALPRGAKSPPDVTCLKSSHFVAQPSLLT
jgi:hypothetical protein